MPASALAEAPSRRGMRAIEPLRVVVSRRLVDVRADWEHLLAVAPASAYQTPAWIEAWLGTLGQDVEPAFVLGCDAAGPAALLTLGIVRHGPLAVARFLGGRDANFGLGLFRPDGLWDAPRLRHLLREAARQAGIDLFWLANQPDALAGRANPMAALRRQPSPSLQHETDLLPDAEAFLARTLSARGRKHVRQKEAKLTALGPIRHETATDAAGATRIATALLAQRAARFGEAGDDDARHRFLVTAATPKAGQPPPVELHALLCGEDIVAAFAGARHAGRVSGMLISFEGDRWARFSPGELLLARLMAAECRAGTATFDLGIGEARYKTTFCPTAVPLFDICVGTSLRGRLVACLLRRALAAKRSLKQSPRLWAVLGRLRRRCTPSGDPRQV